MMLQLDHYAVLGLERHATPADVRRAYRQAARETHPDLNGGDGAATERFLRVQRAYDVLADPARRAAYDLATAQASVVAHGAGLTHGPTPAARRARSADSGLKPEIRDTIAAIRIVARRSGLARRMRQLIRYLERL